MKITMLLKHLKNNFPCFFNITISNSVSFLYVPSSNPTQSLFFLFIVLSSIKYKFIIDSSLEGCDPARLQSNY
uniref:Uncharacterized protein n=1 Tax=Octopus bimaculoides TaxID=37653 RepID=A0A0L8IGH2_OCTBM